MKHLVFASKAQPLFCVTLLITTLFAVTGCKKKDSFDSTLDGTSDALLESVDELATEEKTEVASIPPPSELLPPENLPFEMSQPSEMMEAIVLNMREGNYEKLLSLIGEEKTTAEQKEYIKRLISNIQNTKGSLEIREVGELEINALSRWALTSKHTLEELLFDIRKLANGKWSVEKVTIPTDTGSLATANSALDQLGSDSLSLCDQFVSALVNQRFEEALKFVDKESVSNTSIAALCIMFEEGGYKLRKTKPLRSLFQRDTVAAFMANVVGASADNTGQFGITLHKTNEGTSWKVTEINLDKLVSQYVDQVAGGDAYYTPLVENLEGGNTLALYFEFNKGILTDRSKRQLEIVASVLKADQKKKLTLSGHTDALGSDSYNQSLSQERAENVKIFLVEEGIPAEQIRILAFGETQPRRTNETDQGRRVNRRTEIYLDF